MFAAAAIALLYCYSSYVQYICTLAAAVRINRRCYQTATNIDSNVLLLPLLLYTGLSCSELNSQLLWQEGCTCSKGR
jgi:hypothetical protein